jgi:hypothetical protein
MFPIPSGGHTRRVDAEVFSYAVLERGLAGGKVGLGEGST